MKNIKLVIFDETLRDGEQQVGLFLEDEIKYNLAKLILQTGVNYIALMPIVHEKEKNLIKTLIQEGLNKQIIASTMSHEKFIDHSQKCGVKTIILFHAISDRLLLLRDKEIKSDLSYQKKTIDDQIPQYLIIKIRQRMLTKMIKLFQYAKAQNLKICFAAEDASRADYNFLIECVKSFTPYIEHFILCDTLGILTPEKSYLFVKNILESANNSSLILHFHNDLGLALENTIQGILAGAKGISGTFGGIGERAGNVAIEQVLNGLRLRFGWEVEGINYPALSTTTNYLEKLGIKPNPPYSSGVLHYETGIHVNSLLQDKLSYYPFLYGQPEIWFGKFSGVSNLKYLFEHCLNQTLSKEEYEKLREIIKDISIEQKDSFSTEQILQLLNIKNYF